MILYKPTYNLLRRKIHESSFKSSTNTAKNRLEISWNDLRVCVCFYAAPEASLRYFRFRDRQCPPLPNSFLRPGGQIQYFLIAFTLSSTRSFVCKPKKTSSSAFGYDVYKIERRVSLECFLAFEVFPLPWKRLMKLSPSNFFKS